MQIQPFTLFIPLPPKYWLGSGITSITAIAVAILSGVIALKLGNFSWAATAWVSLSGLAITYLFFEKVYRTLLIQRFIHPIAKEITRKFCDEIIKLFDHTKLPSQAYHDMPTYEKHIFYLLEKNIPNIYDSFGSGGRNESIRWSSQNSCLFGEIQLSSFQAALDIPMYCDLKLR